MIRFLVESDLGELASVTVLYYVGQFPALARLQGNAFTLWPLVCPVPMRCFIDANSDFPCANPTMWMLVRLCECSEPSDEVLCPYKLRSKSLHAALLP